MALDPDHLRPDEILELYQRGRVKWSTFVEAVYRAYPDHQIHYPGDGCVPMHEIPVYQAEP